MSNYVHTNTEWAEALQNDLASYIYGLWEDLDNDVDSNTVSGQPFCGCDVCDNREHIMFLIPKIIDAYKEGILVEE